MPVRDCMTNSPFCPADVYEPIKNKEKDPNKGCNDCVEEGLKNNEIPKCFFCNVTGEDPNMVADYSMESFAKKVMEKIKGTGK